MPRQQVVFIPHVPIGTGSSSKRSIECSEKPWRVWTLMGPDVMDETKVPELPIVPRHNRNAFLEDHIHDWDVRDGRLVYYSRISEGGCWLLLEFKDETSSP
jgi:hypothetical protein